MSDKCRQRRTVILAWLGITTGALLGVASAASPRLGGPMRHLLVSQDGNTIQVCYETSPFSGECGGSPGPLVMQDYGEIYDPPADVLNGTFYNAQYGWLPDGFFSIPPGSGIFIRVQSMATGLEVYDAFTFEPRFTTAGSDPIWEWDGVMTHHWFAVTACGDYQALFEVYIGDLNSAAPTPGYVPGEVLLTWTVELPPALPPDFDNDGDIDQTDFGIAQRCYGMDLAFDAPAECQAADLDRDCDVDGDDLDRVRSCASGPAIPFDPDCLP